MFQQLTQRQAYDIYGIDGTKNQLATVREVLGKDISYYDEAFINYFEEVLAAQERNEHPTLIFSIKELLDNALEMELLQRIGYHWEVIGSDPITEKTLWVETVFTFEEANEIYEGAAKQYLVDLIYVDAAGNCIDNIKANY